MKKRVLSLLLILCMFVSLLPSAAFADEGEEVLPEAAPIEESVEPSEGEEAALPQQDAETSEEDGAVPPGERSGEEAAPAEEAEKAEDAEVVEEDEAADQAQETVTAEPKTPAKASVAYGACGRDVTFTIDENYVLTISGTGAITDYGMSSFPWENYRSQVTALVIEEGVTTIPDCAFLYFSKVDSVTIADTVGTIGYRAISGCNNLVTLHIPKGVTEIATGAFAYNNAMTTFTVAADNPAFSAVNGMLTSKDQTVLYCVPAGQGAACTVPDGIVEIVADALASGALTSVSLPASAEVLPPYAFMNCQWLEQILVDEGNSSYKSVDGILFSKDGTRLCFCPQGKSLSADYTVPAGVNSIENLAFFGLSIENLTIPEGVESIGNQAFDCIWGMKTVTLPASLKMIGYCAFGNDTGLTDVFYGGTEQQWNAINIEEDNAPLLNATIHYNGTEPEEPRPSGECGNDLTWWLSLEDTLFINGSGDMWNYGIEFDEDLGGYITKAPWAALAQQIQFIYVGDGVTSIGDGAFCGCASAEAAAIGADVVRIGDNAFFRCDGLVRARYMGSAEDWAAVEVGYNNDDLLQFLDTGDEPEEPATSGVCGDDLYWSMADDGTSTLVIYGTGDMWDYEYDYDENQGIYYTTAPWSLLDVRFVEVNDGVTRIGNAAFCGCGVHTARLPGSLTSIGNYAFYDCVNLDYVTYSGSIDQWAEISIGTNNDPLLDAMIEYNPITPSLEFASFAELEALAADDYQDMTEAIYIGETTLVISKDLVIPEMLTVFMNGQNVQISAGVTLSNNGCLSGIETLTVNGTLQNGISGDERYAEIHPSELSGTGTVRNHGFIGLYAERFTEELVAVNDGYIELRYEVANEQALRQAAQDDRWDDMPNYGMIILLTEPVTITSDLEVNRLSSSSYSLTVAAGATLTVRQDLSLYNYMGIGLIVKGAVVNNGWIYLNENCFIMLDGGSYSGPGEIRVFQEEPEPALKGFNLDDFTLSGEPYDWTYRFAASDSGSFGALTWALDKNGVLTISGTGPMDEVSYEEYPWHEYRSRIMSIVIENGVTSIADFAFTSLDEMTSVSIADTVTHIGYRAIASCRKLENLHIPAGVTEIWPGAFTNNETMTAFTVAADNPAFTAVNGVLMSKDRTQLYAVPAGQGSTYTVPNGVIDVMDEAFASNRLTSVTLSASVETVDSSTFMNCYQLKEILVDAGSNAFKSLDGVLLSKDGTVFYFYPEGKPIGPDYTVPAGVKRIKQLALFGRNITTLTLPEGVELIEYQAFDYMSRLKTVRLPASLKQVWSSAFANDTNLTDVYYDGTRDQWNAIEIFEWNEPLLNAKLHCVESVPLTTPVLIGAACDVGGVKISWNAVDGAESYRVYRKTGSGGWKAIANVEETEYLDTAAASGTTYTYTVRAVRGSELSGFDKTGKTVLYIAAPVLKSVTGAATGVKISWAKSEGAEKYRVFRKTADSGWTKVGDTTALTLTDTTALSGEEYFYTVRCISSDGKKYVSAFDTDGLSIVFIAAPALPAVSNTAEGVLVKWTAVDGAEAYRVFRKLSGGSWKAVWDTDGTEFLDAEVDSGKTYVYTIRCITADGSAYTSAYNTSGKSILYIAAPELKSVTAAATGLKVTWAKSEGAVNYRVFRKTADSGWSKVGDTTALTLTDTKAVSGEEYFYTVRCLTADAKKYTSAFDSEGMSGIFIAAPALPAVSATAEGVLVKWTAVDGAEAYRVFRKEAGGSWKAVWDTDGTEFLDAEVDSGKTYVYTIRCINAEGTAYTSAYNTSGKSILYIAPPVLKSAVSVATGVKVTWAKSEGAAKYRVFRKTADSGWSKVGDTTALTITDTKAVGGTEYIYTVRCISSDAKSYTSAFDASGIAVTFIETPALPTVSSAVGGIQVKWAAVDGAEAYRVFRKEAGGSWTKVDDTTETSFLDREASQDYPNGPVSGKTYVYTIRCITADGSAYTSAYNTTGKSLAYIAVPEVTGITLGSSGVTLKWNKVGGAAKYRIFRKTEGGSWAKLADTTAVSYTDKTGDATYIYTVRCISSDAKKYTSGYNTEGWRVSQS